MQNQIIIGPTPFTKDRKYICTHYTNQKLEIQTLANKIRDKLLIGGSVPAEILEQIENNRHIKRRKAGYIKCYIYGRRHNRNSNKRNAEKTYIIVIY